MSFKLSYTSRRGMWWDSVASLSYDVYVDDRKHSIGIIERYGPGCWYLRSDDPDRVAYPSRKVAGYVTLALHLHAKAEKGRKSYHTA